MSTIEGSHCIQDISLGPQGVHNRGAPLYVVEGDHLKSTACENYACTKFRVGLGPGLGNVILLLIYCCWFAYSQN